MGLAADQNRSVSSFHNLLNNSSSRKIPGTRWKQHKDDQNLTCKMHFFETTHSTIAVWVITWLSATMCHLAKCPSEKERFDTLCLLWGHLTRCITVTCQVHNSHLFKCHHPLGRVHELVTQPSNIPDCIVLSAKTPISHTTLIHAESFLFLPIYWG